MGERENGGHGEGLPTYRGASDERGAPVNGFLTVHDLFALDIASDLVVLSACRTAAGKELRGEGIVGLVSGGGSSKHGASRTSTTAAKHRAAHAHRGTAGAGTATQPASVTLSLRASGTVYVCLLGDGHKLIPGVNLQPGASTRTYKAKRFEITLGNSAVKMIVDGTARSVPESSQAIGYAITKASGRRPLAPGKLPTCA